MTRALTSLWLRIAIRSGRLFAPLLVAATLLAFIHSGGVGPARATYATAAALVFPGQVWLAQQSVSAVPTETRRVLLVAIRSRRLLLVGVLASAVAASLVVAAASLVWPWLAGSVAVTANAAFGRDLLFAFVVVLVLVPPATVLGVLTSEVAIGDRATAAIVGTVAVVATLVLGFQPALAWLAPPLVGLARLGGATTPTAPHLAVVVVHSVLWTVVVGAISHRALARRW